MAHRGFSIDELRALISQKVWWPKTGDHLRQFRGNVLVSQTICVGSRQSQAITPATSHMQPGKTAKDQGQILPFVADRNRNGTFEIIIHDFLLYVCLLPPASSQFHSCFLMSSKRGRKRNDTLPPNRARDVQRAFRARRAAHLQVGAALNSTCDMKFMQCSSFQIGSGAQSL